MTSHSIFNDVLGPVMSGPSSSHSAGCARIGLMTSLLYGKEVRRANVVFDEAGSYPATYIGQGSNFGFTGGLMGYPTADPRMKDAVGIAAKEGRDISFSKAALSHRHPNEARIDILGEDGAVELSVLTFSTGGGMFEIVDLDGFPVHIDGSHYQAFCLCDSAQEPELSRHLSDAGLDVATSRKEGQTLLTATGRMLTPNELDAMRSAPGIRWVRVAPPILPTAMRTSPTPAFHDATGALELARQTGRSAWELAIDYECSVGEISADEVWDAAVGTYEVMRRSCTPPDPDTTEVFGFLPYRAQNMVEASQLTRIVPMGALQAAALAATSVMENSCAHNIVVAAPTAGSSGVLPGAIVVLGEQMGLPYEEIVRGLLAAGLVGAFIANQATFGAEVAACQAEIGSAACMAAGGIVQMLGGTVEQVFQAASLAMQNMLGLICDPVGGLTEIPCVARNASAVANAATSANMVLWGFDPVIGLDECIRAMLRVGSQLPRELRCTCEGGLCTTETARRIAKRLQEMRPAMQ